MGIVKQGLTVAVLTFGLTSVAHAATYKAADNSPESKLCVTAATASKLKMNKAVNQFVPGSTKAALSSNYSLVANELYCNGIDVAEFAMQAGNKAVAEKLQRYRSNNVEIRDIAKVSHGNVSITD